MNNSYTTANIQILSSRLTKKGWRPPYRFSSQQKDWIHKVKDFLDSKEQARLTPNLCPCSQSGSHNVTDEAHSIRISEVDRFGLEISTALCTKCGTLRLDPYLDEQSLAVFYEEYYQGLYGRALDLNQLFEKQSKYGEKILRLYTKDVKPGFRVLEIGCGPGGALNQFKKLNAKAVGCDFSQDQIDFGKKEKSLDLYSGGFNNFLDHYDGFFDLIYLHHVFEHMHAPQQTLSKIKRILAPNGRILIIVPYVYQIDEFPFPAGDLNVYLHIAHKFYFSRRCVEILGNLEGLDIHFRSVPMDNPELWIECTVSKDSKKSFANNPIDLDLTNECLNYLKKTELMFRFGLCKGQLKTMITNPKEYFRRWAFSKGLIT